jgi:hypothetical protein
MVVPREGYRKVTNIFLTKRTKFELLFDCKKCEMKLMVSLVFYFEFE